SVLLSRQVCGKPVGIYRDRVTNPCPGSERSNISLGCRGPATNVTNMLRAAEDLSSSRNARRSPGHRVRFRPSAQCRENSEGLMMRTATLPLMVTILLAGVLPARAETPVEKRLRVLEEQLQQAQDEIKRLRQQVEQQKAIGQATQKQVEQNTEETKTAT